MIYSSEDLHSLKYVELQKISKDLQLKCGRLKTEKVIQNILKYQENLIDDEMDGQSEMLEDIQFPETILLSDDEKMDSSGSTKKNTIITEIIGNEKIAGKRKRDLISSEKNPYPRVSIRRSNTFIINKKGKNNIGSDKSITESPLTKAKNNLPNSNNNCNNFTRSTTFDKEIESPSKRRRISDSKSLPIIKSPDLTCSEVLTAADIKNVEESQLNPAYIPEKIEFKLKNVTARRSLRGFLLNSRLSGRVSSFEALPSPLIRKRPSRGGEESPNITIYDKKINSPKRELQCSNFTESMLSKSCLNASSVKKNIHEKDKSTSGIPRFVTYAKKLNMPNFSRIHEKNFNNMEAVDDYLERKQNRAKNAQRSFCLSSIKKTGVFKPTVSSMTKRNLNFTSILSDSTTTQNNKSSVKKFVSRPVPKFEKPILLKCNRNAEENILPGKVKFTFSKAPQMRERKVNESRKLNETCNTQTRNLKCAVNKIPKVMNRSDRRAKQTTFLKGVRLNKRFELQMANRGIKLK